MGEGSDAQPAFPPALYQDFHAAIRYTTCITQGEGVDFLVKAMDFLFLSSFPLSSFFPPFLLVSSAARCSSPLILLVQYCVTAALR